MIVFKDWEITVHGQLAHQFDHLTRRIDVVGDLPEGWEWSLMVTVDDNLDILYLEPTAEGVGTELTRDQLAFAGFYTIQLKGTQGEKVRHTNKTQAYVGETISGDAKWPEIPSEFAQIEASVLNAAANAKNEADRAEEAAEMAMNAVGDAAWIGFEMNEAGQLVAVLSPGADADFALDENGNLEVILNG